MKLSIVGMGRVGQAIAFASVVRGIADELVLVGRTSQSALGDALDLRHASCFSHPADVRSGTIADTARSDVVIVAASVSQPGGYVDRRQSAKPNAALFRELIPPLVGSSPDAVFLVVTNPVDVLTQLTLNLAGLPSRQVIGSGTLIDTVRLRALLADKCGVHPADLRIYVLGEHGDSQVAVISSASVGGAPLDIDQAEMRSIADQARQAGAAVARAKGYTSQAVALAAMMIVEAIAKDSHVVLPVSTLLMNYRGVSNLCLSVPAIIGRRGVIRTLTVTMDEQELNRFRQSADSVRDMVAGLDEHLL